MQNQPAAAKTLTAEQREQLETIYPFRRGVELDLDPVRGNFSASQARASSNSDIKETGSVQTWTQDEAIAFECAREVITDMHGILTSQIVEATRKEQPDNQQLASLRAERSRLFQERANLRLKDHEKVARIRAEYGEMVRSWRAEWNSAR